MPTDNRTAAVAVLNPITAEAGRTPRPPRRRRRRLGRTRRARALVQVIQHRPDLHRWKDCG